MAGFPRLGAWRALVADRPLLVVDVETTDEDANTCGVCEVGLACYGADAVEAAIEASRGLDGLCVLPQPSWTHEARVNPGRPIHPGATGVHGITDAMVAACPPISSMQEQLAGLAAANTVAGFNAVKFDARVLRREAGFAPQPRWLDAMGLWSICRRLGPPAPPPSLTPYASAPVGAMIPAWPCMQLGVDWTPQSLAAAHAMLLGRPMPQAHRAVADAAHTGLIIFAMLAAWDLPDDLASLAERCEMELRFITRQTVNGHAEPAWAFTRGVWTGCAVADVYATDPSYLEYVLGSDIMPEDFAAISDAIGEMQATNMQIRRQKQNAERKSRGGRGKARKAEAGAAA